MEQFPFDLAEPGFTCDNKEFVNGHPRFLDQGSIHVRECIAHGAGQPLPPRALSGPHVAHNENAFARHNANVRARLLSKRHSILVLPDKMTVA
jgi:hypothetical protein